MGDIIFYGFWIIILYAAFILVYIFPEESLLFLNRWEYEEKLKFSNLRIRLNKYIALFGILCTTAIILGFLIDNFIVRILLFVSMLIYIFIALMKVLPE